MSKLRDQIEFSNVWSFTREFTVPANGRAGVAIALGDPANELVALWLRASSTSVGLASHVQRLIEDRTVTNTQDPEQGWNRNRVWGDAKVPGLPGLVDDDRFLFHTTFDPATDGKVLHVQACSTAGTADTGLWKLEAGPQGHRYYVLELENTSGAEGRFTVDIEYAFIGKV